MLSEAPVGDQCCETNLVGSLESRMNWIDVGFPIIRASYDA